MSLSPQLQMFRNEAPMEMPSLPKGVELRLATLEDAREVGEVVGVAFGADWGEAWAREVLLDHPEVPRTYVAIREGRILATASLQTKPDMPASAWVHYVAARPDSPVRGLGRAVTQAVVAAGRQEGRRDTYLTTDDFRLPAIVTYLNLGFVPFHQHVGHPDRWRAVLAELRGRR